MNVYIKSLIGVGCAIALVSSAKADQITFQGLSGSSTRENVQKQFPNARQTRSLGCAPGEQAQLIGPKKDSLACDQLHVSGYDVLGLKFDVTFDFDGTTNKLLFVNLIDQWADPNDFSSAARLSKSDIINDYMKLRSILISNHGIPRNDPSFCAADNGIVFQTCDAWQGSPSPTPDGSLGTITLEANGRKPSQDISSYGGTFAISYVMTPQFKGL